MDAVVVHRKRTIVSFVMVAFALALGVGGYVLTGLNQDGALPADWQLGAAAWAALGLVAWGVVRWRLPYADPLLLPSALLLNGLGLAMIYRLDQADGKDRAQLQLLWTAISIAGFVATVVALRDHRRLQRYTYLWFALGLAILLTPLVPGLGFENHGARIWIRIGPYSFQPSEAAKIVLSVAFAAYLVEKKDVLALAGARVLGIDLPRPRDLGPILVMWLASLVVLVFQKDLGTSLLFFGLFVMMLYTATERPSLAILGVLLLAGMGALGYTFFSHVQTRFSSWLDPFSDYDRNLQVINAQFGLAHGGLFGTGWGLGRPYLTPLAKNDFIAAALGEELGLFGLVAVLMVFGLIVARVLRAALAAREPFGKLLAAGLAFVFALQVFTIVGGVTRLLPLTGLTTPFVSQGGSSLVANYVLLGIMLTITHRVRSPQAEAVADEDFASLAQDRTQVLKAQPSAESVLTPVSPTRPDEAPRPDPVAFGAPPTGADDLTEVVDVDDGTQPLSRVDLPRPGRGDRP